MYGINYFIDINYYLNLYTVIVSSNYFNKPKNILQKMVLISIFLSSR